MTLRLRAQLPPSQAKVGALLWQRSPVLGDSLGAPAYLIWAGFEDQGPGGDNVSG